MGISNDAQIDVDEFGAASAELKQFPWDQKFIAWEAEARHDLEFRIGSLEQEVYALRRENAALKEAQRWIPVSERLPEDREEVLTIDSFEAYALSVFQKKATVLDDNNAWEEVENAFYIEGRGINPDSKSADYPTHWMPLPEPSQVTE